MKLYLKISLIVLFLGQMTYSFSTEKSVEERLEDLEIAQLLKFYSFYGSLETRMDVIDGKNETTDSDTTYQGLRNWINIGLKGAPTKRVSFDFRLASSKHFNHVNGGSAQITNKDLKDGQGDESSAVYFDRAYVNFLLSDNLYFTFGRLPTTSGKPSAFSKGLSEDGGYLLQAYDANFDGVVLTKYYDLDDGATVEGRLVYSPFTVSNYTNGELVLDKPNNNSNEQVERMLDMLTWMISYTKRKFDMTYQGFYVELDSFSGGSTGQIEDLKGIVNKNAILLEWNSIMNSSYDAYLNLAHSRVISKGLMTGGYGYLTDEDRDEVDGTVVSVGVKKKTDRYQLGLELISGSKHYFDTAITQRELTYLYNPRGSAAHLFYNYNFIDGIGTSVGFINVKRSYSAPVVDSFGKVEEDKLTQNSVYTRFFYSF